MKRALFILSGNLSTTPRALKVIESYKEQLQIDILAVNRSKTWAKIDLQYQQEKKLNLQLISISKKRFFLWLVVSLVHSTCKLVYRFHKKNIYINAWASEKASIFLWIALQNYSDYYDFVASFSYGSIFPASVYAEQNKFPLMVDIEDYHPGEVIAHQCKNEQYRRESVIKECLPKAALFAYASPLIGMHTLHLINKRRMPKHVLVNNSFFSLEFVYKQNVGEKVRFVWFSQTISFGRGLEMIIPALLQHRNKVELTLIGKINPQFANDFVIPNNDFITSIPAVSQKELHLFLSEFDVGLAIEPGINLNNALALSNKIWAYAQSGLYILATNTQAQILFMNEHIELGVTTRYEVNDMSAKILGITDNISQIRALKAKRFQYAKRFAWETESEKLKNLWKVIMPEKV